MAARYSKIERESLRGPLPARLDHHHPADAPWVNVVSVRYSEAFVGSLRLWNRPNQGTIVVQIDSFTPRVPLEILLGLGRGTSAGSGRTKDLEFECRDWLRVTQIKHLIIPYADRLQPRDFEALECVLEPSIRLWFLSFRETRKLLETKIIQAEWKSSSTRKLNPRREGIPFGGTAAAPKPTYAEPMSWVVHRTTLENHVLQGICKVEMATDDGLLDLGPRLLGRWIAIAAADHTGTLCQFRLLGITLKLAALERPGEVHVSNSEAVQHREIEEHSWEGGRAASPSLIELMVRLGFSRLELRSLDAGQLIGSRGFVSMAGFRFRGHLAIRLHARALEIAHSGRHTWLFPEADQCDTKRTNRIPLTRRPPFFVERSSTGNDAGRRILSPRVSELDAIIGAGRIERLGESLSFSRASNLDERTQRAIDKLVDARVMDELESRFEIRSNLRQLIQRAIQGTE